MHVIFGATGQVGSILAKNLYQKGLPVRAVVRNQAKAHELQNMGIEVVIADYLSPSKMLSVFEGGTTAFLLTPENPTAENSMEEVKIMIRNFHEAVKSSGIRKIVGLSSMGAQDNPHTGNLYASFLLESGFLDLAVEQVFVRPAYYFSNWVSYWDLIKEQGILPTFFPTQMQLEMIAPKDVADFLTTVMIQTEPLSRVYEISGPRPYRASDIASAFEEVFHQPVTAQQILPEDWESTLQTAGFSKDAAVNLIRMTKAVMDGRAQPKEPDLVRYPTLFETYLDQIRLTAS